MIAPDVQKEEPPRKVAEVEIQGRVYELAVRGGLFRLVIAEQLDAYDRPIAREVVPDPLEDAYVALLQRWGEAEVALQQHRSAINRTEGP